ncbi:unnamed protein product [marine sediment metagenome]|uniref:Uncharacterized protein n=1 Tax=marine sediment metagenome TaxID=412755 RepID=X1L455_9ZZZZ
METLLELASEQACDVPSSLDSYVPKLTADEAEAEALDRNRRRRRKRAYQRVKSGLTVGGCLRFITLTSSPTSPPERLGRDLSNLVKRLRRKYGKFEYVSVKVPGEGHGVVHVIARGSYIPQMALSTAWGEVHGAPIVDIRRITRTAGRVGNYVISQYVAGQKGNTRMSWSWGWVYRGFCRRWAYYKKTFRSNAVSVWGAHLRAFRHSLDEWRKEPPPELLGINPEIRYAFKLGA